MTPSYCSKPPRVVGVWGERLIHPRCIDLSRRCGGAASVVSLVVRARPTSKGGNSQSAGGVGVMCIG